MFEELLSQLQSLSSAPGPRVILLRGHRGSGKSALLRALNCPCIRGLPWRSSTPGFLAAQACPDEVLAVDDAHYADPDSLRQLVEAPRPRVLILAAERALPLDVPLDAVLSIPSLRLRDIQDLALRTVGVSLTAATLSDIQTLTGGRPALVHELFDAAPADAWHVARPHLPLPQSWAADLDQRLAGADLGALLSAVALRHVDDVAPADIVTDLDPACPAQLGLALERGIVELVPHAGRQAVAFRMPTDLAVARSRTDPRRSAQLHARARDLYLARGDADAALLHSAFGSPRPNQQLAAELNRAARAHADYGHHRRAAATWDIAAELSDSPEHRVAAIDALIAEADMPAVALRAEALPSATAPSDVARIRTQLALDAGRRHDALSTLPSAHDAHLDFLTNLLDWNPAALAASTTATGSDAELRRVGEAALHGSLPADAPAPGGTGRDLAMGWLYLVHDDAFAARGRLSLPVRHDHRLALWTDAWLARTQLLLGELRAAEATVERALARSEHFGIRVLEPLLLWTGATSALYRGDRALARFYLSRLPHGGAGAMADSFAVQAVPAAMSAILAASMTGDNPTALRTGRALAAYDSEHDISHPGFWPWEDVVASQLILHGHHGEADALLSAAEDRAARSSIASLHAKLAVPRASLHIHHGDIERGVRTLRDAVERIDTVALPAYQSRVYFEYGRTLRRLGRRRQADEAFARAATVFADMGATEFVERCNRERRAGGLGARSHGTAGLTPQESEIAKLVAAGLTNAQAAQELFLSPKTVEYHLTRIYKKLGVRSRGDVAAKLH